MKFIQLLLLLSVSIIYSQKSKCYSIIDNEIISKLKNKDSKNIIPYFSKKDAAWGYFEKETKIKIIAPIFKEFKFFNPYIFIDFDSDLVDRYANINCRMRLYGSVENYKIELPDSASAIFSMISNDDKDIKKIKNINGFEIDSNNNLIAFNKKFYDRKTNSVGLSDFFKLNDTYYGILNQNDTYSIVNQNGKFIKGFKNLTNSPKIIYKTNNDILFLISKKDGYYEIKSLFNSLICKEKFNENVYIFNSNIIGYEKISFNGEVGIFDLIDFKWKIQPNNNLKIMSLEYSTNHDFYANSEIASKSIILENRKLSDIYIVTESQEIFDLDLNKFEPLNE